MPWELYSGFSRLRRSARRQTTLEPPRQGTTPEPQPVGGAAPELQIDRRILQDPSSLLEVVVQDAMPLGLTPSTRVPSADASRHGGSRSRPTDLTPDPLSAHGEPPMEASRTKSRLTTNLVSRITAGGEWSTFGRKREQRVPDVERTSPMRTSRSPSPTKHDKHLSTDSILSTFTPSRLTHAFVGHEGHSTAGTKSARQSPDTRFSSSKSSSPAHPHTPQRPSSYTALGAGDTMSPVANPTTPLDREQAADSPHTFGHPTPPNKPPEISVGSPFPVPPLPLLDHPELATALSSRRQSMSVEHPASSVLRDRSNTLPASGSPARKDDLLGSLSLRLRRSLRQRASISQSKEDTKTAGVVAVRRRRARTVSAVRRTSADWSSYEASVGSRAWPGEVSRQMVNLSLHSPPNSEGAPGSPIKRRSRTRVRSTDPDLSPNRGAVSVSFLPFPHPSRPSSPGPINSIASATLTGTRSTLVSTRVRPTSHPRADRREVTPRRPHSLQFDLGSPRGGQRSTRYTMAEVKRSLSAIEARNGQNNGNGGATYPSLALGDPAPQPQLLHPSLAPTPSKSYSSSRVFPNAPMVSSTQGEPSTPTPAPRHLSDKSRGKRKAEDNIDVTPPEQKKEGQRATFLLPAETRSQRISNSSHAPSSYHRKRARLSSTSPFATPVQSRPPSVQETPKSAGRNHHFASLSSSTGAHLAPPHTPSRAASTRSRQPRTPSTTRKHERRTSMSQVSIPISAIVSPHAPSVSTSTKFHMRDPRKPPKKPDDTLWSLRFATEDEPGSPIQAWCFFFGFLLFPVWWIAGLLLDVPKTRIAGEVDAEKGVPIDDPQIEYNARIWRFRCRVMTAVSLFTYVPFIVLVAIFAPR